MQKTLRAVARCLSASVFFLCVPLFSQAQTPPGISKGVHWLAAQVQSDGSLQYEAQSIATPWQSRAEVAQTLGLLGAVPSALAHSVNSLPGQNTQYLSRKILSENSSGTDASGDIALLVQRQNVDGGFGGLPDYASDPDNTAWAIMALAQARQSVNLTTTNKALSFLKKQIEEFRNVVDDTPKSRVYGNMMLLLALQTDPDSSKSDAASSLRAWLGQRRNVQGNWFDNTFLTACALLALSPSSDDAAMRIKASAFLQSRQLPNGSWSDDPFIPAIALRALSSQNALNQT